MNTLCGVGGGDRASLHADAGGARRGGSLKGRGGANHVSQLHTAVDKWGQGPGERAETGDGGCRQPQTTANTPTHWAVALTHTL